MKHAFIALTFAGILAAETGHGGGSKRKTPENSPISAATPNSAILSGPTVVGHDVSDAHCIEYPEWIDGRLGGVTKEGSVIVFERNPYSPNLVRLAMFTSKMKRKAETRYYSDLSIPIGEGTENQRALLDSGKVILPFAKKAARDSPSSTPPSSI